MADKFCPIKNGLCEENCRFLAPFISTTQKSCAFEVIPSALTVLNENIHDLISAVSLKKE